MITAKIHSAKEKTSHQSLSTEPPGPPSTKLLEQLVVLLHITATFSSVGSQALKSWHLGPHSMNQQVSVTTFRQQFKP